MLLRDSPKMVKLHKGLQIVAIKYYNLFIFKYKFQLQKRVYKEDISSDEKLLMFRARASLKIEKIYGFSKVIDYQVITPTGLRAVEDHSVNTAV